jgi:STE24 endopeptidase
MDVNIYFIIILATLIINYAVRLVANILNLRSLKPELPDEFSDVFDEENYRKSQEYTKTKTKFQFLTSTFSLIVLLIFWFSGGFNALDLFVRGWGFGEIVTGLFYIGIILIAWEIISLPFEIYATFVIEEKYDFNKTSPKTFVMDKLKAFALTILLGAPLLAGLFAFFEYAGAMAWLYCWIAVSLFSIVMMYFAPKVIMPLFNKFTPLEDEELKSEILDYVDSVNFDVQEIYVMDGSKRSSKSNAFFTGFGKNKRIALFDTLIENHTVSEIVAILAHEVGHYKKKHVLKMLMVSIIQTGLMFFLLSIFITHAGLFQAFGMEHQSIYAGFLFFGMLYSPLSLIFGIVLTMFVRKNEYDADKYAARTTTDPGSMISALKKLAANNLSNLTPHPFYVFLNYTHPPMLKRIRALKQMGG